MAIRDEAVLAGRLGLEAAVHFSRAIGYKDEGMVDETKRELYRSDSTGTGVRPGLVRQGL